MKRYLIILFMSFLNKGSPPVKIIIGFEKEEIFSSILRAHSAPHPPDDNRGNDD